MARDWVGLFRRALKKPPKTVLYRAWMELHTALDRYTYKMRVNRVKASKLLQITHSKNLDELWQRLLARPFPWNTQSVEAQKLDAICPGSSTAILNRADLALQHEISLLGSGPCKLGNPITWNRDFKTGYVWPNEYILDIEYGNPTHHSDVKVPWDLSRLQWLQPAGQAYLLTGDEKYAQEARNLLSDWIDKNPYAGSVVWSCTMEVAMRVFSWTWFFYVFGKSKSWADPVFREKFLCALYLHGEFTKRHLEYSDVNGNHCTTDLAALVMAGEFWRPAAEPESWHEFAWKILNIEIEKQIFPDGVDFEASIPYHRLVLELFLIPMMCRRANGLDIPATYKERIRKMAHFTAAYTKPSGHCPLVGDADDGRAFAMGGQSMNDHRYLIGLVGLELKDQELLTQFSGPRDEIFWWHGPEAAKLLPDVSIHGAKTKSQAFDKGGFYVLRGETDHVFIDCGPVGLAGRGGHGHNDALAFEAWLDGVNLITDCGAFVYTQDFEQRNHFRSTQCHNTPQIDSEEINRFLGPFMLWNLSDDAKAKAIHFDPATHEFIGEHYGYRRLPGAVTIRRELKLDTNKHAVSVTDTMEGTGKHRITIPLYFDSKIKQITLDTEKHCATIELGEKQWSVRITSGAAWELKADSARVSPSYGIAINCRRLTLGYDGTLPQTLKWEITSESKRRSTV